MKYRPLQYRRNKYNARKVIDDGITFDSKAEHTRYRELKLLERAGEITDLKVHPAFTLVDKFVHRGKTIRAITYKADFAYTESTTGECVVEDVKGGKATQTAVFKIKRKLFLRRYGADYDFRIVEM